MKNIPCNSVAQILLTASQPVRFPPTSVAEALLACQPAGVPSVPMPGVGKVVHVRIGQINVAGGSRVSVREDIEAAVEAVLILAKEAIELSLDATSDSKELVPSRAQSTFKRG